MSWDVARQKIGRLAELQEGWDSYGGLVPSPDTLAKAVRWTHFLERMGVKPPRAVVCSSGGEIVFEFSNDIELYFNDGVRFEDVATDEIVTL